MTLGDLRAAVEKTGLAWRGAFHPEPADNVPAVATGVPTATMILLGFTGSDGWRAFAASHEAQDGQADPLDRWSRRIIDDLSVSVGAVALYPFNGPPPPWPSFLRWGRKCEPLFASPLGMLIHPKWGLWHSYRGALMLSERIALPPPEIHVDPCTVCATKPCLSACPVKAFSNGSFNAGDCRDYLESSDGQDCRKNNCQARRACPVGAEYHYAPDQVAVHMRGFMDGFAT